MPVDGGNFRLEPTRYVLATSVGLTPRPPESGKEFIHSNEFGDLLVDLAHQLASRYPNMDFSDAVAHVFAWFDGKLSRNRRFINARRFPTLNAFLAYVRQALWNAARLTERVRQRHERVEALPIDRPIVAQETTPEERMRLIEMVDKLPQPHKTAFERFFFEEEDLSMIASVLHRTEEEVYQLYEEAVDMLADKLSSGSL